MAAANSALAPHWPRGGLGTESGSPFEETVKIKVDRLLMEAGLSLGEPTQLENLVMAINRIEGAHQDETNRGLALLVREGRISREQSMRLAIAHAKQV